MHNFLFKTHFEWFRKNCTCFSFFSGISFFSCFFFFLEKLKFTHSLVWKACFFFPVVEKKKQLFYSLTRFLTKSYKKQTFPGKKRYLWKGVNFFTKKKYCQDGGVMMSLSPLLTPHKPPYWNTGTTQAMFFHRDFFCLPWKFLVFRLWKIGSPREKFLQSASEKRMSP